ncbi:MAG: hypothetical protein PWQ57_1984 [Desulfovibrionales bacterium]|nr:hypothetical protein [Desulfovibrionales bacterium]
MNPLKAMLLAAPATVGGQAVIEGVMMRAGKRLAIAVRRPEGAIQVEVRPWFSLTRLPLLRKPFIRGFPILLETLVNGIKALNHSAKLAVDEEEDGELKPWHVTLTVVAALGMAIGLFVVLPHLFSAGMNAAGLGGDARTMSFQAWDGLFKLVLFTGYIYGISLIPDIKRVFQYHGAEHKVIWTYEQGQHLTPETARLRSRLHPRCGTAFLLFVLAISILLFAALVPLLLALYTPQTVILRHTYIVAIKIVLMVPISAVAYEMIKFAGRLGSGIFPKLLTGPGLLLQMLTTKEPDSAQLEVAIAALNSAVAAKR